MNKAFTEKIVMIVRDLRNNIDLKNERTIVRLSFHLILLNQWFISIIPRQY